MSGKIICFDGIDGCGKHTISSLLYDTLGGVIPAQYLSFPNYDSLPGRVIRDFLNGAYGDSGKLSPYLISTLYAVDRGLSYETGWGKDYEDGKILICDRYVPSNMVYQTARTGNSEMADWVADLEYGKYGLPKPDCVIILDIDPKISYQLMMKRYQGDESKLDVNERNILYLTQIWTWFDVLAKKYGWHIVSVLDEHRGLRPPQDILKDVQDILKEEGIL